MAESESRQGGNFSGLPGQAQASISQASMMALAKYERDSFVSKSCKDFSSYHIMDKIGQGTFGEVFVAIHKEQGNIVATKKVLIENEEEGIFVPVTTLRELRSLRRLRHENVVHLREIRNDRDSDKKGDEGSIYIYIVYEFCEHDLAELLNNFNVKFSLGEIKSVIKQLMNGLEYIHSNKVQVLHGNMKATNILITNAGNLKLADCGLTRAFSLPSGDQLSQYTSTQWYCPPELLLGERNYGPAIDLWGAGCIMAEMWTRTPIMQGNTEQHQLALISILCGSITANVWPGLENLELTHTLRLPQGQERKVKERMQMYVEDEQALDVMDKLLTLDPRARIDADVALNHDFFRSDPMPCSLKPLLSMYYQ